MLTLVPVVCHSGLTHAACSASGHPPGAFALALSLALGLGPSCKGMWDEQQQSGAHRGGFGLLGRQRGGRTAAGRQRAHRLPGVRLPGRNHHGDLGGAAPSFTRTGLCHRLCRHRHEAGAASGDAPRHQGGEQRRRHPPTGLCPGLATHGGVHGLAAAHRRGGRTM